LALLWEFRWPLIFAKSDAFSWLNIRCEVAEGYGGTIAIANSGMYWCSMEIVGSIKM